MTTKLISIHQYRANLTKLWKKAKEENVKYLVMVHGKPVFEVTPIMQENSDIDFGIYELPENQISSELKEKLENAVKTPQSDLLNI